MHKIIFKFIILRKFHKVLVYIINGKAISYNFYVYGMYNYMPIKNNKIVI